MGRALITGGAGFIGSNLTSRLLEQGHEVVILDDLSRPTAVENLEWLSQRHGERAFELCKAGVEDAAVVGDLVADADVVYHLAAQVAVTTSVLDPRRDFEANVLGTVNILEAARIAPDDPVVVYASTNKVYGDVGHTVEQPTRHSFIAPRVGIDETQPLDFRTPYGCSKGAADQYVLDYHRVFGVRTVVFRQSCIYGPRQFGIEDQGWVAWFILAALRGDEIRVFGDGKQLRDVLHVDDLLDAYDAAVERIDTVAGQAFNIGGGPQHTMSIWAEFGPMLERLLGRAVPVTRHPARSGDQRVYVSDITKVTRSLDWCPRIGVEGGVELLLDWIRSAMTR